MLPCLPTGFPPFVSEDRLAALPGPVLTWRYNMQPSDSMEIAQTACKMRSLNPVSDDVHIVLYLLD